MKFLVTETHIKMGLRKSNVECPICKCVKATLKKAGYSNVEVQVVNCDTLFINGHLIWLPESAVRFTLLNQAKQSVQPFSFEIDLPSSFDFSVKPPARA